MTTVVKFIKFIVDMVKALISLVKMAVNVFTTLFSFLPPQITSIALMLLVVCLLYKILGRENQS